MSQPPRGCLFCGGLPLTREHVLPDWLHEVLDLRGKSLQLWAREPIREVPGLDIVLRRVCASCNNVWLNNIEGQFKSRMSPALHGLPLILDVEGQRVVALWAAKTWLMMEAALARHRGASPAAKMPPAFYTHLRRFNEPPPILQVWIGQTDAAEGVVSWLATKPVTVDGNIVGIVSIMTLGRLLFHLYASVVFADGPARDEVYRMELGPTLAQGLTSLHPSTGNAVVWPPDLFFAMSDLQEFWMGDGHEEAPVRDSN